MKALEDLSMQYDRTVRNSEQSVVQFTYGDDGLNPNVMEKKDRPVDYSRLCGTCALTACACLLAFSGCSISQGWLLPLPPLAVTVVTIKAACELIAVLLVVLLQ
jgi:hypothetical protein